MRKISFLLLAIVVYYNVYGQARKVRGTVSDKQTGETLIGVFVNLKGTTRGVSTDANGNYNISLPGAGEYTLVFRYLGYKQHEVRVTDQEVVNVALEMASNQLDEVVTIGYGTVKKRDVTGSISSVGEKQLKDIPINSAAEALTGRLAGVQVVTSEGSPDADVRIRVRGGGSITQDNSPLYIIDGVQVENGLAALSPQDIESIDVLKDASTTAIYGARGANGVVIITTKTGKDSNTTINYNGFLGTNMLSKKLDVMNPYEFIVYQYERSRASSRETENFTNIYGTFDDLNVFKNVPYIDWQEEILGNNALMQTHHVNINGAPSKATNFAVSYARNRQLYDFGYGLSYTRFDYKSLKISKPAIKAGETVVVSVEVTNTGDREGEEVVQLYINGSLSEVTKPVKELKGFQRIHLKAKETKTVSFSISPQLLYSYDINMKHGIEPGAFRIMVGKSSRDADLLELRLSVE